MAYNLEDLTYCGGGERETPELYGLTFNERVDFLLQEALTELEDLREAVVYRIETAPNSYNKLIEITRNAVRDQLFKYVQQKTAWMEALQHDGLRKLVQ